MIGHDWYVGMEVVFIGAPDGAIWAGPVTLAEGQVCTIAEIRLFGRGTLLRTISGYCRIPRDAIYIGLGRPNEVYVADAFRPVQKRKTDISIFTAMLTGAKERERA